MFSNNNTEATKPWFNDGFSSRLVPFSMIPRVISTKADPAEKQDKDNNNEYEDEDDREEESEQASLDTQVKAFLSGPASSDFGSKKFKQLSFNNRHISLKDARLANDTDAPPKGSIFDQDNQESVVEKPVEQSQAGLPALRAKIDANSFNVFNSNFSSQFSKNPISKDDVIHSLSSPIVVDIGSPVDRKTNAPTKVKQEHSVVVSGYPESDSLEVIDYFSKYGEILENFEVLSKKRNNLGRFLRKDESFNAVPIYVGKSWVKLTFGDRSSYLRALKEDDTVFKNYFIKVKLFNSGLLDELKTKVVEVKYSEENEAEEEQNWLFPRKNDGNYEEMKLLSSDSLIFKASEEQPFKEEPPVKKIKTENNRLTIITGKQLLVKKNPVADKKEMLTINSHPSSTGLTWLDRGLDWAFGINSL